jgi:hypothetical protein
MSPGRYRAARKQSYRVDYYASNHRKEKHSYKGDDRDPYPAFNSNTASSPAQNRRTRELLSWPCRLTQPALDKIYKEISQPAVYRTGFELKTVTQRAGLIDDHIRVDIRRSRFLISELTGGNQGAYWEAGFAEGLGKRVVYTCEKSYFDNPKTKPHFDANHYSHVIWEEGHLSEEAAEELIARARASIPAAKMSD